MGVNLILMPRIFSLLLFVAVLASSACRGDYWCALQEADLSPTQKAAYLQIRSAAGEFRGAIEAGTSSSGDKVLFRRAVRAVGDFCGDGCGPREEAFLAEYFSGQVREAGLKLKGPRKAAAAARALRGYRAHVLPVLPEASRFLR